MTHPPPIWVCPPADAGRKAGLRNQLEAWTTAAALERLISAFGESIPETSLGDRLSWLEAFSSRWDFRRIAREQAGGPVRSQDASGSARWEIGANRLDEDTEQLICTSCDELGLVSAVAPARRDVSYLVVLGGARSANLLRPRYAADLLAQGAVTARHIILLGGSRAVMDSERDATDAYAPAAATEFDLLTMGASDAFSISIAAHDEERHENEEVPSSNWRIWRFPDSASDLGIPVTAIEAPSRDSARRRANTADAYAFFAQLFTPRKSSVLLVTSQIYVPYQHLEAVRALALPFELELETVAFPPRWLRSPASAQQAANYLQETRSTILAAKQLFEQDLRGG